MFKRSYFVSKLIFHQFRLISIELMLLDSIFYRKSTVTSDNHMMKFIFIVDFAVSDNVIIMRR